MSRKRLTLKGEKKRISGWNVNKSLTYVRVCVLHLRGIRLAREMIRALGITTCRDAQNLVTFSVSKCRDDDDGDVSKVYTEQVGKTGGKLKFAVAMEKSRRQRSTHSWKSLLTWFLLFFLFSSLIFFSRWAPARFEKLYNGTFDRNDESGFIWFEFRLLLLLFFFAASQIERARNYGWEW